MRVTSLTLTFLGASAVVLAIAAQAQTTSKSPFAKKKKKQAWEVEAPAQPPLRGQSPPQPIQKPGTLAGPTQVPNVQPATQGVYVPPTRSRIQTTPPKIASPSQTPTYVAPAQSTYTPPQSTYSAPKTYQPTQTYQAPQQTDSQPPSQEYNPNSRTYQTKPGGGYYDYQPPISQEQQPLPQSGTQNPPPNYGGAYYPGQPETQQPKQSLPERARGLKDRLGFGNLVTAIKGYLKIGSAATKRDGWDADFIADGSLSAEVSAITEGGLEYGIGGEVRAQYDKYRRGFGGRAADCPPTIAGCSSTLIAGTPTGLRGHTSQFYTDGPNNAKKAEYALEGAYLFLRSAYGDITVGRDDGAAYLFSLGAPSLLAVGASNSPVDYTGLDAVKTVNDASGFSEKVAYTSPRFLGDTVGVGVQVGVSYAPNAKACGVDFCVRENGKDGTGVLSPDLKDVVEVGVALDRKFDNGLAFEATATYARATEDSAIAAFNDLKALGLGLEVGYNDWTLGGSYLHSNNGVVGGSYRAWDTGVTWQPSQLGFTLGYGEAKDNNINLKSKQVTAGISYDFWNYYRVSTGAQYIRRDIPSSMGGIIMQTEEDATALFIEGRAKF